MQRTKSFSVYALIIAVLIHLVVILLLAFIEKITPVPVLPPEEKPAEERFRLSLKERPEVKQEALIPNTVPTIAKARPIPRGEQLKTPTPITRTSPEPQRATLSKPEQPAPPAEQPSSVPSEPKKAFERHVAKNVATIERQPKKEQGLYDILSKADSSASTVSTSSITKVGDSIQKLYGDKFNELSPGEQKYILDNQEVMRRITQAVLDRYGRSKIPDSIRINDINVIEFYLHPDGSISNLHFLKNSQLSILDDTTKETIELAYAKYPRPEQKTLIRYRVWYNLGGN